VLERGGTRKTTGREAVLEVKPLDSLGLFVRFADGLSGEVRVAPEHLTGVFEPPKNPDVMCQEIKENGGSVLT